MPQFLNYLRPLRWRRSSSKTKACKFFRYSFSARSRCTSASWSSSTFFGLAVGDIIGRAFACSILDDQGIAGCFNCFSRYIRRNCAGSCGFKGVPGGKHAYRYGCAMRLAVVYERAASRRYYALFLGFRYYQRSDVFADRVIALCRRSIPDCRCFGNLLPRSYFRLR